ncbi:unnamed protein product [Haemonchus placei]|uniref:Cadherin_C domain-containing protein n=1 Tax=Haemonchus placei TaxID=6290 RepID=A0A158QLR6_HAEPC|nr:unnamed protein product [Haemonchus placei]
MYDWLEPESKNAVTKDSLKVLEGLNRRIEVHISVADVRSTDEISRLCKVEANVHIEDGHEGEIDLPIPVGKGIGYRLPISGNYHRGGPRALKYGVKPNIDASDTDDISMTYGQNLHPVDPFLIATDQNLFRSKRHADFSKANEVFHDIHDDRSLLDRIEEQTKNDKLTTDTNAEQDEEEEYVEMNEKNRRSSVYDFLYKRLKQDANSESKRKRLTPNVYMIPGVTMPCLLPLPFA